jgi:REP element-mobilizing transposase RayT
MFASGGFFVRADETITGDGNRMTFNPDILHRRSLRLRGYDYRSAGAYFVTICSFQRECLFGEVVDGEVRLNAYGEIVREDWLNTAVLRPNVELDAYVIMPNHFHAVIFFLGDDDARVIRHATVQGSPVGAHRCAPDSASDGIGRADTGGAHVGGAHVGAPLRRQSRSLGSIVAGFKSAAAKRINTVRDNPGCPVWQRNYYDRVIRSEKELANIRQYIADNPAKWDLDENNPVNAVKIP